MKKLYRFYLDCGRSGSIRGVFSALDQEVDELVGKTLVFDEVLGKHSFFSPEFSLEMVNMLSDDQEKIEWFDAVVGSSGHNPFDYIAEDED